MSTEHLVQGVISYLSFFLRYCQKLPGDQYTILAPEFEWNELSNGICQLDNKCYDKLFTCTIRLPMSSPVKSAEVNVIIIIEVIF